jgi:hypothetical protein
MSQEEDGKNPNGTLAAFVFGEMRSSVINAETRRVSLTMECLESLERIKRERKVFLLR